MHTSSPPLASGQSTPRHRHPVPPCRPSEGTLFRLYAAGDLWAREELTKRYLPLAHRLAARYRFSSEPTEDLQQVAALSLLKALDRYQPDIGPFVNYAIPMIRGELKRHFRDRGWTMRVSRSVQEHVKIVQSATDELAASLGHSPSAREIAGLTGLTLEEVLEALEAYNAYSPLALDAPSSADADDSYSLADKIGYEDERYELVEFADVIADVAHVLPPREREVLYLRFAGDMTQGEIGERIGISQMQVSRLLRRSLDRLSCAAAASAGADSPGDQPRNRQATSTTRSR